MAENIPPPDVQDFDLQDAAGIKRHLLQLSAAESERGPTVFVPNGTIDFPEDFTRVNQLDPPEGRIRFRWNGTSFEGVTSAGVIIPIGGGGGSSTFLALTDTPGSYLNQAGRAPAVNVAENGLEFVPLGAGGGGDALTNEWLLGSPLSYASEVSLAANQINYQRVYLPAGVTVARGQFETTNITGPNAQVRIGLYDQTDPDEGNYYAVAGQPNDKVAESVLGSVGAGSFTFNYGAGFLVPASGYYWVAIVRNAGGGQKRFRSTGGVNRFVTPRWIEATAGGALPANATPATPTNDTPAVLVTTKV